MAKWVMTSQTKKDPWELRFFIGAIQVAEFAFVGKDRLAGRFGGHASEIFTGSDAVSSGMKRMHELLSSPPDEAH